jgi:hypothetical protein
MTATNKIVASAIGIAVIVGGILWLRSGDPLEAAAIRLIGCIESKNAGCVLEYFDSGDRSIYNLDRQKVDLLLTEYERGVVPGNGGISMAKQASGTIVFAQRPVMSRSTNKPHHLSVVISETEEGIRAPQLVTTLLLMLSAADAPIRDQQSPALSKLEGWALYAKNKGTMWADAGIPGIVRDPSEGMIPWSDWEKSCLERLEKLKARS